MLTDLKEEWLYLGFWDRVELNRQIQKKIKEKIDQQQEKILTGPVQVNWVDSETVKPVVPSFGFFQNSLPSFGVVLLAGGQGSRFGLTGEPKGCFELQPKVTLFSVLCRKLKGKNVPLAIMTSSQNHRLIQEHFYQNDYFGLKQEQVEFFVQSSWPVISEEKKWVLNSDKKLFEAPIGNGDFYAAFVASGLWKKWKEKGVEAVQVIPVDNVLADPLDQEMLGLIRQGYDLVVRGIEKLPEEKIGSLALKENRLHVIEYTDPIAQRFSIGYSGLFCIRLDRLYQIAFQERPWYLAKKEGTIFSKGEIKTASIMKCEQFIFDAFNSIDSFVVLDSCRKKYFCPLKDKESIKNVINVLETVQNLDI